ncbi:hypothetical protein V6N12_001453 [Hibiscus sabdariffa]|uniref:Di19 C-terminal domain-containing protein n=1 Tax=Hibiscus sabdariffa TaxID=183260 RepID=A0ABR2BQL7_9ROSI
MVCHSLGGVTGSGIGFQELHDAHYQSLLSRSWSSLSSSNTGPDLLLSFLYSAPPADSSESVQRAFPTEVTLEEKGSNEKMIENLKLFGFKDLMYKVCELASICVDGVRSQSGCRSHLLM